MMQQAHRKHFQVWKCLNNSDQFQYPFVLTSPALGVFIHFLPDSQICVNLEGFQDNDEMQNFLHYYTKTDEIVPLDDTTLIWFIHNYIDFKRQLTSFTYFFSRDMMSIRTLPLNDSQSDELNYKEVHSYLSRDLGSKITQMITDMRSTIKEHIKEFHRKPLAS